MKILGVLSLLMMLLPSLLGCSVFMAATGKEEPDVARDWIGTSRADVEAEFGTPAYVRTLEDGSCVCQYSFEVGNEPSAGRAVVHGVLDVFSAGLWELLATPVELEQGEYRQATITYDAEGRVREIRLIEPPSEETVVPLQ